MKFREGSRMNRNCACSINRFNSFGLLTGSVVDAMPDIPLPGGGGGGEAPNSGK